MRGHFAEEKRKGGTFTDMPVERMISVAFVLLVVLGCAVGEGLLESCQVRDTICRYDKI